MAQDYNYVSGTGQETILFSKTSRPGYGPS